MSKTLNAIDRCDRCAAAALVRVEFAAGFLDFCGHHYTKHEAVIGREPVIDNRTWSPTQDLTPALAK